MLTLAKIMLDITVSVKGRLLLPQLCYGVVFPVGPRSVTDLQLCLRHECIIITGYRTGVGIELVRLRN